MPQALNSLYLIHFHKDTFLAQKVSFQTFAACLCYGVTMGQLFNLPRYKHILESMATKIS